MIRRFTMYRKGDISATHNELQRNDPDVAQFEGVVFSDGTCVLRWCTPLKTTSVWSSFEEAIGVYGHPEEHYGSELVWHDVDSASNIKPIIANRVKKIQEIAPLTISSFSNMLATDGMIDV